jgi:hypothetical protein
LSSLRRFLKHGCMAVHIMKGSAATATAMRTASPTPNPVPPSDDCVVRPEPTEDAKHVSLSGEINKQKKHICNRWGRPTTTESKGEKEWRMGIGNAAFVGGDGCTSRKKLSSLSVPGSHFRCSMGFIIEKLRSSCNSG